MKEKTGVPIDEQELHINYCPAATGKECEAYTTIPWLMKYFEKMATEYPDDYRIIKDDQYGITVALPFKFVKPRKPRNIPEEQKTASAERLRKLRAEMNA